MYIEFEFGAIWGRKIGTCLFMLGSTQGPYIGVLQYYL